MHALWKGGSDGGFLGARQTDGPLGMTGARPLARPCLARGDVVLHDQLEAQSGVRSARRGQGRGLPELDETGEEEDARRAGRRGEFPPARARGCPRPRLLQDTGSAARTRRETRRRPIFGWWRECRRQPRPSQRNCEHSPRFFLPGRAARDGTRAPVKRRRDERRMPQRIPRGARRNLPQPRAGRPARGVAHGAFRGAPRRAPAAVGPGRLVAARRPPGVPRPPRPHRPARPRAQPRVRAPGVRADVQGRAVERVHAAARPRRAAQSDGAGGGGRLPARAARLDEARDRRAHPRPGRPAPVSAFETYRAEVQRLLQGLGVARVRFVDEPVAAALGYGLSLSHERTVLVVDIGGGTIATTWRWSFRSRPASRS